MTVEVKPTTCVQHPTIIVS